MFDVAVDNAGGVKVRLTPDNKDGGSYYEIGMLLFHILFWYYIHRYKMWQCLQIRQQYEIKNKAAMALRCESNAHY